MMLILISPLQLPPPPPPQTSSKKTGRTGRSSPHQTHHQERHCQDVAVKLLDCDEKGQRSEAEIASLRAAFAQEVAVWHKLDHPNVTKFIGAKMVSSGLQRQPENCQIWMPSNVCCVIV